MTSVILHMQACLNVEVGMEFRYDCPAMSPEDAASDRFFKRYRGSTGTIVGFPTEYVGLLDSNGRLPGVYYHPGGILVRFETEEVHQINLHHATLLSPTTTANPAHPLTHQRAGDLPEPILFYPGDVVHTAEDLLQTDRLVERVAIRDNGTPVYILAETEEDRTRREQEDAAQREENKRNGHVLGMLLSASRPQIEVRLESELILVRAGNIRWLYTDPSQMDFDSPEDEILFWANDGLSKVVFGSGYVPVWKYPLAKARQLVEGGEGDLIVRSHEHEGVIVVGETGDHHVRRLHDCFAEHRDRVHDLTLSLDTFPQEKERSFQDLFRSMRV